MDVISITDFGDEIIVIDAKGNMHRTPRRKDYATDTEYRRARYAFNDMVSSAASREFATQFSKSVKRRKKTRKIRRLR